MVARNLHVELSELASLAHEKKDNFAWDQLRRSLYYDLALKTIRFEKLVSVTFLSPCGCLDGLLNLPEGGRGESGRGESGHGTSRGQDRVDQRAVEAGGRQHCRHHQYH